jgi:hypothetical protein
LTQLLLAGLLLITFGGLHIWAREGVSEVSGAIHRQAGFPFGRGAYTENKCLAGCAMIGTGLFLIFAA